MSKKNGLTLRITGPDGSVVESTSDQDSIILGSGAGAAVRLVDPRVSNLHVMLKVETNGVVTAIDLGSETGTRVGSSASSITQPVPLSDGDVLHVGATQVRVLFGGDGRGAAAAAVESFGRAEPARSAPAARPAVRSATSGSANTLRAPSGGQRVPGPVPPAIPPLGSSRPPPLASQRAAPARRAFTGRLPIRFEDATPPGAEPTETARVLQVALLWGGDTLLDVRHFRDGAPVIVGEGRQNSVIVYSPRVGEQFALAENRGSQAAVHVPEGAQARVARRGQAATAASGSVELGLHDRAEVRLDTLSFVLRYVRPDAAVSVGLLKEADYTYFKIASV